MSGFEVAGVVLGAYPILISFCRVYKDVFNGLEGWRTFRSRFEDFALSLETERLCFRDTLKSLLCSGSNPFVQTVEEADLILNTSDQQIWGSDELSESLQTRLGEKYTVCLLIIKKLDGVMTELYRLLDIERGQVALKEDHTLSWWQEKLDRTKFSFSTKRVKKLSQLKSLNEDFDRLVRTNEQFDKLRSTAFPDAFISLFKKVRQNADGLYTVIKHAWTCECSQRHLVQLRLEKRERGQESAFFLRFNCQESVKRNVIISVTAKLDEASWQLPTRTVRFASHADAETSSTTSYNNERLTLSPPASSTPKPLPRKNKVQLRELLHWRRTKKPLPSKHPIDAAPTPTSYAKALPPLQQEEKVVNDLCCLMRLGWKQGAPFLYDSARNYRFANIEPQEFTQAITLRRLLDQEALTKRQRIKIASVLASSLLQLEMTPWLNNGWRKDDIWLLCSNTGTAVWESPFVFRSFFSTKTTPLPKVATRVHQREVQFQTTLIQFGILLLELCFGETLDSRMTKRSWNSVEDDEQQKALMEFTAALDWSTEVQDEFPDFKGPIDRCLKESFGERVDWSNTGFLQKVYMNLVKPLSETIVRNGWEEG